MERQPVRGTGNPDASLAMTYRIGGLSVSVRLEAPFEVEGYSSGDPRNLWGDEALDALLRTAAPVVASRLLEVSESLRQDLTLSWVNFMEAAGKAASKGDPA